MACLSFVSRLSLVVLAFCCHVVKPAPHIVGGGYNTDFSSNSSPPRNVGLIKSAFSSQRQSGLIGNALSNSNNGFDSTDDHNSDVTENESNLPAGRADHISGIRVPPPPMSGLQQVNPLFRQKRHACQMKVNLGSSITELQSLLTDTQFVLRYNPKDPPRPKVPSNQPKVCPSAINSLWSRPESNLRSSCPWTFSERDLGQNAYPRYVLDASCLCQSCLNTTDMDCQKIRQNLTYYEHQGCQDGLALMVKKVTSIVVGCTCAHA